MAGILEIRRGATAPSLTDGEFYLNSDINAVQIGSGSTILTLLPINRTITGDIILNGNVYANNLTGSSALSTTITANQTVGGIDAGQTFSAGTDFTSLFYQLLVRYVQPVTSNLILYNGGTPISSADREVGSSFTFNRFYYNSTQDSPGNNYAINGEFSMTGATNGTNFTYTGPNPLTSTVDITLGSTVTPIRNSVGSITFTIDAKRPDNTTNITPLILNYNFRFANILAASATNVTNNATAQTVYNSSVYSQLASSVSWTANCTNDNNDVTKFTYIIYPAAYSDITSVSKGATDVTTAFTKLSGTYTITNGNGVSNSYKIYKSTQPGAYRLGDNLIII